MKKRILSLALVMVCGLLPVTASAAATVTEVVPPKYGEVKDFSETSGTPTVTEIVPPKYDEVRDFSDGLAAVWLDGKWGFVDATGKEVIHCQYDDVESFHEGLAAVELDNKWGFIDKTGKEVVSCQYRDVGSFSEGLARVEVDNKEGFIDTTGKEVVPCKYWDVENFSEGLAAVRGNEGCGFIDKTGKEVVPCQYRVVENFSEGLAAVMTHDNAKWGFIDKTGKEVVPRKYENDSAPEFHEGLAVVRVGEYPNDKWGFIDTTGKEVVPCKYAWVGNFSEGLAAVALEDGEGVEMGPTIYEWGFIDATGKEVHPCKYRKNYAPEFHEGLAVVWQEGKGYGYIDTTGKEVVPFGKYDCVDDFSDGLAAVQDENYKWGFIDKTGNEVVPIGKYDYVKSFSDGLAAVQLDGKWGFLAIDGSTDTPSAPVATTAYASTQVVTVDGRPVTFNAYALKDANGNDTNYIKLRDVADVLSSSAARFQVGYDGSITITTGQMYTPNGSENIQNFTGNQSYAVSTSPVTVNGVPVDLEAIVLTDASGGGYTYFKLRDLGAALGFNVGYNGNIFIESDKPYDPNN